MAGDEYEVAGARVIRLFGSKEALAKLAAKGPAKGTELLAAAELPEEYHRLAISRSIPCDVKAWADACPKPAKWEARES